jgi:hypothetical protein
MQTGWHFIPKKLSYLSQHAVSLYFSITYDKTGKKCGCLNPRKVCLKPPILRQTLHSYYAYHLLQRCKYFVRVSKHSHLHLILTAQTQCKYLYLRGRWMRLASILTAQTRTKYLYLRGRWMRLAPHSHCSNTYEILVSSGKMAMLNAHNANLSHLRISVIISPRSKCFIISSSSSSWLLHWQRRKSLIFQGFFRGLTRRADRRRVRGSLAPRPSQSG